MSYRNSGLHVVFGSTRLNMQMTHANRRSATPPWHR